MVKFFRKKPKDAGFSLIEVLVSVLIFSMTIAAIVGVMNSNLDSAQLIRDNFIASGLVQEGMEVVRNMRDTDWLASKSFGSFGASGITPDGDYRVQWNSQTMVPLGVNPFIKKDSGNGLFSYDIGNDTIFKRTVIITTISPYEKRVVISVDWNEKDKPKSVSAEDHLFNWK